MTAKQMLKFYGKVVHPDGRPWTFEALLEKGRALHRLDPLTFKFLPFMEQQVVLSDEAFCMLEQCVAIEKGWA